MDGELAHRRHERSRRLIAASFPLQILISGAAAMLLASLAASSPAPRTEWVWSVQPAQSGVPGETCGSPSQGYWFFWVQQTGAQGHWISVPYGPDGKPGAWSGMIAPPLPPPKPCP